MEVLKKEINSFIENNCKKEEIEKIINESQEQDNNKKIEQSIKEQLLKYTSHKCNSIKTRINNNIKEIEQCIDTLKYNFIQILTLLDKVESINQSKESFKEYLKSDLDENKLKELLKEISKKENKTDTKNHKLDNEEYNLKYFDSKSILMKVTETIQYKPNSEKKNGFNLITNIEAQKEPLSDDFKEIDKDNDTYNDNKKLLTGYKDLNETIRNIREKLLQHSQNFKEADIYKSLGQKDITVIVKNASIDTLNQIIEDLNEIELVNRTFSIFCSENQEEIYIEEDNKTNSKIDNKDSKYILASYIRVPKNQPLQEAKNNIKTIVDKENGEIYQTTGVMDYRINWGNLKSIETLFKHYEDLYEYISDYQTKIEKKF